MKLSEFSFAVRTQFGATADVLTRELVLPSLGNQTAAQALAAGAEPRQVWDALCDATDVPIEQRVATRLPQTPVGSDSDSTFE